MQRYCAQSTEDKRHYLRRYRARLVLPDCSDGFFLASDSRLGDEQAHGPKVDLIGSEHGVDEPSARR